MHLTDCLPVARFQCPAMAMHFKDFFYLADYTLQTHPRPAWQKMTQLSLNGTNGTSPTIDRQ